MTIGYHREQFMVQSIQSVPLAERPGFGITIVQGRHRPKGQVDLPYACGHSLNF
jgi:hypothetical protein